tara:strand:- start:4768 stop:5589 length:822 start_codon:yes stop_codon:yes gene_type:complete
LAPQAGAQLEAHGAAQFAPLGPQAGAQADAHGAAQLAPFGAQAGAHGAAQLAPFGPQAGAQADPFGPQAGAHGAAQLAALGAQAGAQADAQGAAQLLALGAQAGAQLLAHGAAQFAPFGAQAGAQAPPSAPHLGAHAEAAGAQQLGFAGQQLLGLQHGACCVETFLWYSNVVPQHGRAMVGLQQRGWQVGAQPQLLAAPHLPPPPNMEENRPASALAFIPSRATTAVSDWIHFILSVSLRLNRVAARQSGLRSSTYGVSFSETSCHHDLPVDP